MEVNLAGVQEPVSQRLDGRQAAPYPLKLLLRTDIASSGAISLPLILVLGATAVVAYPDHRVVSISLIYLYIFPLSVGAIFLRKELSYSLIATCIATLFRFTPSNPVERPHFS